jgi:hypothetical protein
LYACGVIIDQITPIKTRGIRVFSIQPTKVSYTTTTPSPHISMVGPLGMVMADTCPVVLKVEENELNRDVKIPER